MRIRALAPPALSLTLGAAALVATALVAGNGDAYVLLGHSLDLDQRDFRVFDNFPNPEANDNTTPQPSFPGQTGAVMAIWKASVEWGSELHGDGAGDPHQPGDLGSGGADFDATFQGRTDGPGALDSNVHSAIPCAGGVLAYVEQATGAGWRIRYCSNWCWDDGPGTANPPGCWDLQGVAAHQYGHVLGLGHSSVPGATMYPTLSGSGISARSIEADDAAGIQAIYGVASPTKPRITAVVVSGALVTVTGANLHPTSNAVWFTRSGPGGDGTPVSVGNVPSSMGGTQLSVTIPPEAGPGDVLVRVPGTGGDALSNAFPAEACPPPSSYCVAAPNSVGAGARIGATGSTHVGANDLVLTCVSGPPNQNGVFYYGPGQAQAPFGDGLRCVAGPFCRLPVTSFDTTGAASFALDVDAPPDPSCQISAGDTWFFQLWYRDPAAGGSGFNLSDGLRVNFCL